MAQQNYSNANSKPHVQHYLIPPQTYQPNENRNFRQINPNNANNNYSMSNIPQIPRSPVQNYNPNSPGGQYPQNLENYQATSYLPPNFQYPVLEYKEKLFLKKVLVVATYTNWKFKVKENIDAFASNILVSVRGEFEPFHQQNSVSIPVSFCQSIDDYHFHAKSRRLVSDIPTWKAYRLPPEVDREGRYQVSKYIVVLSKPQKWGSQMLPVTFYFKGVYDNRCSWEKPSSQAIILTNSANKWYEKAFITLCLVNYGYNPKTISKLVDSSVKWEHFLAMIDAHVMGATGCKRLLSQNTSVFTPLHINSLMKMVKCNEKNQVSIKNIRLFCTECIEGEQPPLKQIEETLSRYRESWESGKIIGIIESNVVEKFLLGQNLRTGSFILRIQYNSPKEICASSLQSHPLHSPVSQFVDHLTISRHVAPNDEKLMEYLCTSPIHQILLPFGISCNIPMNSTTPFGQTKTYRTTDQELQRTNQLLQKALQSGFNPLDLTVNQLSPDHNYHVASPVNNLNIHNSNSMMSPIQLPPVKSREDFKLDPKVAQWLTSIFKEDTILSEILSIFEEARVNLESLHLLDKDDLKEMGIPIAPRKVIIKSIEMLKQN